MTDFHVGQVVVCIDDTGFPSCGASLGERYVKAGGVYTVRAIRECERGPALLLAEVLNPVFEWLGGNVGELGFHIRRFRPAKPTSIEVFERMLGASRRRRDHA